MAVSSIAATYGQRTDIAACSLGQPTGEKVLVCLDTSSLGNVKTAGAVFFQAVDLWSDGKLHIVNDMWGVPAGYVWVPLADIDGWLSPQPLGDLLA